MDKDFLLIWRMRCGDETAVEQFVRKYYENILKYCFFHSKDRDIAQDLTQETFARFFCRFEEYCHKGKALNYLYVIARNLCIDYGRKTAEIAVEEIPERGEDPTELLADKLDLEQALCRLPRELREIIVLHYFQDMSLRECADILGIGLSLAKYRIKKGKELLQEWLEVRE